MERESGETEMNSNGTEMPSARPSFARRPAGYIKGIVPLFAALIGILFLVILGVYLTISDVPKESKRKPFREAPEADNRRRQLKKLAQERRFEQEAEAEARRLKRRAEKERLRKEQEERDRKQEEELEALLAEQEQLEHKERKKQDDEAKTKAKLAAQDTKERIEALRHKADEYVEKWKAHEMALAQAERDIATWQQRIRQREADVYRLEASRSNTSGLMPGEDPAGPTTQPQCPPPGTPRTPLKLQMADMIRKDIDNLRRSLEAAGNLRKKLIEDIILVKVDLKDMARKIKAAGGIYEIPKVEPVKLPPLGVKAAPKQTIKKVNKLYILKRGTRIGVTKEEDLGDKVRVWTPSGREMTFTKDEIEKIVDR